MKCEKNEKFMICYCGKCDLESYPLPRDFFTIKEKSMKWEYKIVEVPTYGDSGIHLMLNDLGKDGWENYKLVQRNYGNTSYTIFYLKRQV